MIMKKSTELKMDLNAKDNFGRTAFHYACNFGKTIIIERMISNSKSLKLDLNAKDTDGKTAFKLAQIRGKSDVVNLIASKMRKFEIFHLQK